MNNKFDDIRPYVDSEIAEAMNRISTNPLFPTLSSFVFPDRDVQEVKDMIRNINNIYDFQVKVMHEANLKIIEKSISNFSYEGIEYIDKNKKYLYVSNHRDIMLDASLMQSILLNNKIDTTEITFGANLMEGELVIDVGKSNKMFRVERPGGSIREFYKASKHLSEYIRTTILEKKQSVWIAQRNGRTKDGLDSTDQGIINMFRMSYTEDKVKSIVDLNILPVAVSYEWEPCDILKTIELYMQKQGPYIKKKGEDLNSILTGILQYKGNVHFEFCEPLSLDEVILYKDLTSNDFNKQIATLIDKRIWNAYHLTPNNYIAYDLLNNCNIYESKYTIEQKEKFISYMSQLDSYKDQCNVVELKNIFLGIYANPINVKKGN